MNGIGENYDFFAIFGTHCVEIKVTLPPTSRYRRQSNFHIQEFVLSETFFIASK